MTGAALRILNPDEHPRDEKSTVVDILDVVTDIQQRLQAIESTIQHLSQARNKEAIVALIHKLDAEDKGLLQKFIRHIRKYDQEVIPFSKSTSDALEDTIHDLRNGLSGLQAYIQMIEKGKLAGREKVIFSGISKTAHYVEGLISDVLSSKKHSFYQKLSVACLLQRAVRLCGMPEVRPILEVENTSVKGDEVQLMRVFNNLLENAYQALPAEKGIIIIQAFTEDDQIMIMISDNGMGIPQENLPKIFLKHFTTKANGKGIGLTICRTIIEDHGGTIQAESELGKGTTFIIQLSKA